MTFKEHEVVRVTCELHQGRVHVPNGSVGTIVAIYRPRDPGPPVYGVEFELPGGNEVVDAHAGILERA